MRPIDVTLSGNPVALAYASASSARVRSGAASMSRTTTVSSVRNGCLPPCGNGFAVAVARYRRPHRFIVARPIWRTSASPFTFVLTATAHVGGLDLVRRHAIGDIRPANLTRVTVSSPCVAVGLACDIPETPKFVIASNM